MPLDKSKSKNEISSTPEKSTSIVDYGALALFGAVQAAILAGGGVAYVLYLMFKKNAETSAFIQTWQWTAIAIAGLWVAVQGCYHVIRKFRP